MINEVLSELKESFEKTYQALGNEFAAVRTGRASGAIFEKVLVDAYGSSMPLTQTANIRALDAHTIVIEPWDKSIIGAIERGILASDLGLNPNNDGAVIRVSFPQLTEERRRDLVKLCKQYAEEARIATRNARRDAIHKLDKLKDSVGEDEIRRSEAEVQKLTDDSSKKIDEMLKSKEAEVMEV